MASIGVTPATPRLRLLLVTSALVAAVAFVVIGQLNSVLSSMRSDGGVAGSVSDLTVSFVPFHIPDEVGLQSVVSSWKTFDTQVVEAAPSLGYAGPIATANAVLRWDAFLYVPAYAAFVLGLLLWARTWPPAPPGQPVPRAIAGLARWWVLGVVLVITVAADEAENVFLSRLIDSAWEGKPLDGQTAVVVLGIVKWIGLILLLAPFAIVAGHLVWGRLRPILRTAWFPIALLVLLGVATASDQAVDVVRRWGVGQTIWSMLGVALLAAAMGTVGSRSFQIGRTPVTVRAQGRTLTPRALARAALSLLPLGILAVTCLVAAKVMEWRGMIVLGLVFGGAYLLSLPVRHFWDAEQTVEVPTVQSAPAPLRHRIGAVLAALVPFLVGLGVVRASAADLFYTRSLSGWLNRPFIGLVLGIVLVVAGTLVTAVAVGWLLRWMSGGGRIRRWTVLLALLAPVALAALLLTLRSTWLTVSQGLGGVAIVLVFLSVLALAAGVLHVLGDGALRSRWAHDAVLPSSVRLLGFERPPLVGLIVLWLVLAALIDPGGYHDIRQLSRPEIDVRSRTIVDAFAAWRDRQPDAAADKPSQPLVMVAASGGGLRSAYWTSLVLDCVLERDTDATGSPCGADADAATVAQRRARLFAMSGTGGGGLGLVTYDTHSDVDGATSSQDWFDQRLSDDFLSPTLAWGLFRDTTAALLRPGSGRDRASALERALEHPWRAAGDALAEPFLTGQSGLEGPLMFLSGTSVADGCRLSTAIVATSGGRPIDQCGSLDPALAGVTSLDGTTDLLQYLCPETNDIRRSTAAVLGARFPLITPAGRVVACGPEEGAPRSYIVDGGYRDSSAASVPVELWPRIQPLIDEANKSGACIVPYFVQIDSEYDVLPSTRPNGSPSELLTGPEALRAVPGGNADAARVAAQRTFTGPIDDRGTEAMLDGQRLDSRWQLLAPKSHPGGTDPLSWVLPESARNDLKEQVTFDAEQINQLRRLLDAPAGSLTCSTPTPP